MTVRVGEKFPQVRFAPGSVELASSPWGSEPRARGVKRKGIKYEKAVLEWVTPQLEELNCTVYRSQWLSYRKPRHVRRNFAQPDLYAVSESTEIGYIVEVKLTRCAKAWYQLNRLYEPLLQDMYPGRSWIKIEIASKIVPVDVPEPVLSLQSFASASPNKTWLIHHGY